jgi:hypothetical protein
MQLNLDFDQASHLHRVTSKTSAATTSAATAEFFAKLEVGATFHAQELRDHVAAQVLTAPASPDRVMRKLRQVGEINYELVDRRGSLYRKLAG